MEASTATDIASGHAVFVPAQQLEQLDKQLGI